MFEVVAPVDRCAPSRNDVFGAERGTDFSDGAQCALEHAVKLAGKIGARVAVVHVYEDHVRSLSASETATKALRDQLERALARAGE